MDLSSFSYAPPRLSLAKLDPHFAGVGLDRSLNSLTINFQKTIQGPDGEMYSTGEACYQLPTTGTDDIDHEHARIMRSALKAYHHHTVQERQSLSSAVGIIQEGILSRANLVRNNLQVKRLRSANMGRSHQTTIPACSNVSNDVYKMNNIQNYQHRFQLPLGSRVSETAAAGMASKSPKKTTSSIPIKITSNNPRNATSNSPKKGTGLTSTITSNQANERMVYRATPSRSGNQTLSERYEESLVRRRHYRTRDQTGQLTERERTQAQEKPQDWLTSTRMSQSYSEPSSRPSSAMHSPQRWENASKRRAAGLSRRPVSAVGTNYVTQGPCFTDVTTRPEFFVIHPDWVSESMTIQKLTLNDRHSKAPPPVIHKSRTWSGRRCKSAPPSRLRNPITWEYDQY